MASPDVRTGQVHTARVLFPGGIICSLLPSGTVKVTLEDLKMDSYRCPLQERRRLWCRTLCLASPQTRSRGQLGTDTLSHEKMRGPGHGDLEQTRSQPLQSRRLKTFL